MTKCDPPSYYGGPYLQTQQTILETQHNIFETQVNICETQHKVLETIQKIVETQHKIVERQHKITETQHKVIETQHKITETRHKIIETQHKIIVIARESTARKTTVCSNDPATCVSQVNWAVLFLAMSFRQTVVVFYQVKVTVPFLSCCIFTIESSR